ncbi:hypothetical protein FRB91_005936 [Serendipita sp. 411]|nr:hypothetical protein FRC16_003099 [Serendipita sp. 398]KAG8816632.1 hypothetical protein FRC19_011902 [Serendipita sp. 401]KAG8832679.1 hypothetical protein FRC18_004727 [Serendipita sp. 400]KAG8852773.1 hypothetical protein FRB91_005936 [Serendipita sp. 411]KAG8868128.1 hypothetical protein FRC20_004100 [Serendipita sp. 405]KAG9054135.1 hypothetical protein FS842_006091 [Serendipita sp. 407]
MGPTGVGKTTFINCVAQRGDHGVGHDIESCTADVELIKVGHTIGSRNVVLVDTPGFDDTYRSDIDILTMIAEFLVRAYKKGLPLDTILYLHRITDKRMTGSLMKNLKMFVSLCGIQSMPAVTIVTTMWNEVDQIQGQKREQSLIDKMWFDMIEKGSDVRHFYGTYESALEILGGDPRTVNTPLLPEEMVGKRRKLKATAAGSELAREVKSLLKQRKEASRKLQELSKQSTNEIERRVFEEELHETNEKIRKANEESAVLRRGFLDRLFGSKSESSLVPQVGSVSQS